MDSDSNRINVDHNIAGSNNQIYSLQSFIDKYTELCQTRQLPIRSQVLDYLSLINTNFIEINIKSDFASLELELLCTILVEMNCFASIIFHGV